MKAMDVKYITYTVFDVENNDKYPIFRYCNYVRIM